MPVNYKGDYANAGFILPALSAWFLSSLVLVPAAALILCRVKAGAGTIGYVSSALSFAAAVTAGIAAGRASKAGALYTSMVSATVIVIALLTVGFLVKGSEIESGAVISVVSFSFSGCVTGGALAAGFRQGRRRRVKRGLHNFKE